MLPVPVLERCASEMLNYKGSGMSVMEMSHRSKVYDGIITETEAALRRVLSIPDNYKVLFLQGGASTQFAAIPMNLLKTGKADYALTGNFANNAYKEAVKFGDIHVAFSSKERNFDRVPTQAELDIRPDADYFYICANNTIYGTEYQYDPETRWEGLSQERIAEVRVFNGVEAMLKALHERGCRCGIVPWLSFFPPRSSG